MKHILIMEAGSFKVLGGAGKDTYKLYRDLKKRKDYNIDVFGDFSKMDRSIKHVSRSKLLSTKYDLIWMNSIRDVPIVEEYRKKNPHFDTKFLYVDRGNVLLNFNRAGIKKFLPKMLIRRYFTYLMEQWLDYYIAISVDQYVHAKRFFRKETDVRYIMIAPHEEFKPTNTKKSYTGALSVSRLDERQKKMNFMIKGIARVKELHPKLKDKVLLKIVGSGIDEDAYQNLASSLSLEKNVVFEGFLVGKQLMHEYNNAGFFVSTSEWEGLGRSLLEAMACGLPLLINQNINTLIREKPRTTLIEDDSNGFVYKYNDIDDFANKFYLLYSNAKLQERFSSNTKEFMKQFSFEKVVRSYERIIDNIR